MSSHENNSLNDTIENESGESACCPRGSLGPAPALSDKSLKGHMIEITPPFTLDLQPLPCYLTGTPLKKTDRIVVIFSDVYGIDAGHHKHFSDELAGRLGCSVLLPDLFRGNPILQPWIENKNMLTDAIGSLLGSAGMLYRLRQYTPSRVDQEIFRMILPFLHEKVGTKKERIKLSCVGFCFGGWVVGRALGFDDNNCKLNFQCGVGIHPSFQPNLIHGELPSTMAKRIQKPILFLPAWNDWELKPNSNLVKIVQATLSGILDPGRAPSEEEVSVEFPEMIHGWVSRGDKSNPKVAAEQERALTYVVEFIQHHA